MYVKRRKGSLAVCWFVSVFSLSLIVGKSIITFVSAHLMFIMRVQVVKRARGGRSEGLKCRKQQARGRIKLTQSLLRIQTE